MFKGSLFKLCLQAALMSTVLTIIVLMCFYFISTMNKHVHNYDTDEVVAATCEVGGYTKHICSCGAIYTDDNTVPLGHDYNPETGVCARCGKSCTHKWGVGEHKETLEHKGYTEYRCKYCEMTRVEWDEEE